MRYVPHAFDSVKSIYFESIPANLNCLRNQPAVARDLYQKCREYRDSADARAQGFYPYFRCIEEPHGNYVVCEGEPKIMIGSNNYLGLAQDPRVIEAACDATRRYGAGCTGSRLLNGTIKLHVELEEALAAFLQRESVVLFSTGFFANQGALASLTEEGDAILCDRENHASIIDGCQFAPAKLVPYRHNSPTSLRNRISLICLRFWRRPRNLTRSFTWTKPIRSGSLGHKAAEACIISG